MELVVRAEGWQGACADAVSKEDLCGTVDPRLRVEELVNVRSEVLLEADHRPRQRDGPEEENGHDEVGEESGEPDDLAR